MKNRYEIQNEYAIIFIERKDGTKVETIIDLEDLEKVRSISGRWYAHFDHDIQNYYISTGIRVNGKAKSIILHRLIMDAPKGLVVDHINHNTLDNRKYNLRLITSAQNIQNLRGAQKHNKTSGIRGVCWDNAKKRWLAYLQINKKKKILGRYKDMNEAAKAVEQARAKHMPYSLEALEKGAFYNV